jgi:hypothetical protein
MAERLAFDVFGKRLVVERTPGGWQAWRPGPDGKRSPVDIEIPAFIAADELLQYLDDIYHELATPANPCVRRVTGD